MQQAGIYWVRFDIYWADIEATQGVWSFSAYDYIIDGILSYGLQPLAIVQTLYPPAWYRGSNPYNQPPAPQDYATFASQLSTHYKGRITLYEIGNEVNSNGNWYPASDASQYTTLLQAGYSAIKTADPNAKVISSGLSASGGISPITFLTDMYANGSQGYMDYIGFHPYCWPASPDNTTHIPRFNYLSSIYSIMRSNGDGNKQIAVTEVGWPTSSGGVKESIQAAYIARAFQKIMYEDYQYVAFICIYDFVDDGTDLTNPENNFGILHTDYSKKPAYTVLQQARNAYRTHFNRYAPRVFGSPVNLVRHGFVPRALRAFGSPVRWGSSAITVSADSVSLTDRVTLTSSSTVTQSSETVAVSETLTNAGKPQIAAEQVQPSEDTITFSNVAGITNTIQLLETIAPSGVIQPDPDVAPLLEVFNPIGQLQNGAESVQLSESADVPHTINRYALRTFGSPVRYGSAKIVISAESVSLADQVTLVGVLAGQFPGAETVAISETLASTGQAQIAAEQIHLSETLASTLRYGLRAFGAPVRFASAGITTTLQIVDTLSVSLGESSVVSNQVGFVDATALDETTSLIETTQFAESVVLSEGTASTGNNAADESTQLADTFSLIAQSLFAENVSVVDLPPAMSEMVSFTDALQLLDVAALLGTNTIAVETVSINETQSLLSTLTVLESLQIAETITSSSAFTQAAESASLSDAQTLLSTFVSASDSVQITETLPQQAGLPTLSDSSTISEALILSGLAQNAVESTALSETLQLVELLQFIESLSLLEIASVAGVVSPSELAQLLELAALFGFTRSSDSASLLEVLGTPKKYALRSFGSPVRLKVSTNVLSITESVALSESQTQAGNPHQVEAVSTSETLQLQNSQITFAETIVLAEAHQEVGTTSTSESVQCTDLSTFSGASSQTETVSVIEILLLQAIQQVVIESILLAELTLLSEATIFTEVVQISDSQTQAGLVISSENVQINETLLQASNITFVVSALIDEQISATGVTLLQESVLLLPETLSFFTIARLQVPADSVLLSEIFLLLLNNITVFGLVDGTISGIGCDGTISGIGLVDGQLIGRGV